MNHKINAAMVDSETRELDKANLQKRRQKPLVM